MFGRFKQSDFGKYGGFEVRITGFGTSGWTFRHCVEGHDYKSNEDEALSGHFSRSLDQRESNLYIVRIA